MNHCYRKRLGSFLSDFKYEVCVHVESNSLSPAETNRMTGKSNGYVCEKTRVIHEKLAKRLAFEYETSGDERAVCTILCSDMTDFFSAINVFVFSRGYRNERSTRIQFAVRTCSL